MSTLRQVSREDWNSKNTILDIGTGCLQRIADALDAMAGDQVRLKEERDTYLAAYNKAERQIKALRGVITRLKKKR